MKKQMMFTILAECLGFIVGVQNVNSDSGLHKGWVLGCGHEECEGLGFGHDKHGCDPTCTLCGGYPCVPPCPGVGALYEDEPLIFDDMLLFIWFFETNTVQ